MSEPEAPARERPLSVARASGSDVTNHELWTHTMIFATLVLERPPLQWADVPGAIATWITVVGGFASFFLALWLVYYALGLGSTTPAQKRLASLFSIALLIALVGFAAGWGFTYLGKAQETQSGDAAKPGG